MKKHTQQLVEITMSILSNGRIQPNIAHREDHDFTLPLDAPITLIGKHVNVSWSVKLSLDVPGARDIHTEEPFTILPALSDAEALSADGQFAAIAEETFDECRLRIELPPGSWRAGDTVDGRLRLDALEDCGFPEIRVELLRHEVAGESENSIVEDTVSLERDASFSAGRSREWRFSVTIPTGLWPTAAVSKTSIGWSVRGILARSRRRDFSLDSTINVG